MLRFAQSCLVDRSWYIHEVFILSDTNLLHRREKAVYKILETIKE